MIGNNSIRFVKDGYNYDSNEISNATGLKCDDLTRTQQSSKDECDINNIMRQFNITGNLPSVKIGPTFGDFSLVNDFQSALEAVQETKEIFDDLPAHLREKFDYNPANLINFLDNPENRQQAIDLGLIDKPPVEVVSPVSQDAK